MTAAAQATPATASKGAVVDDRAVALAEADANCRAATRRLATRTADVANNIFLEWEKTRLEGR